MGYFGRDVEVVDCGNVYIVTACDSSGAIGSKELDVVKVTPYIVGRYAARVPLLEILSAGAYPIVMSVTISNELNPTGEGILDGVYDELKANDIKELPIAISTEKNMTTKQTAVGVTVVGRCGKEELRIGTSRALDDVYFLGIPKVGNEVDDPDDKEVAKGNHIKLLSFIEGVHDILPVGSRGILAEAQTLAKSNGCELILELIGDVDVNKSAGPSTCLLFTCSPGTKIPKFLHAPVARIGRLK
ncbi:hypothetical protein OXPF_12580 [Oxobacter pfennigii]|uniref:Alpha-ribazole kinase n=1 Tax=Oxobacter pfennigii TaxID=36849 RepID=A0A0P8W8Z5_9CLOT|nr:hypothetical protein [Oxobacter pfennigii]KPU45131.1 hypothetical protein OXPF_12580 [Oxobacter pfennigii]